MASGRSPISSSTGTTSRTASAFLPVERFTSALILAFLRSSLVTLARNPRKFPSPRKVGRSAATFSRRDPGEKMLYGADSRQLSLPSTLQGGPAGYIKLQTGDDF